jgi:hypothetical protein
MGLSEFIRTNAERIAREWEEFAKTCTPAAIGVMDDVLLDDVTHTLEAVANDMEQPQTPAEQEAKGKGRRLNDTKRFKIARKGYILCLRRWFVFPKKRVKEFYAVSMCWPTP